MTQAIKQPFSIQDPVGAGETNRAHDLEATRNALAERRLCRRSVTGQTSATYRSDLAAGIRIFQRQAGLEPDGLVIPGGPTAMALALGRPRPGVPSAEGKQVDATACNKLKNNVADVEEQIRDANRGIDDLEARLDRLEPERDRLRARLDGMLGPLGLGFVPNDENLGGLFRDLDNVPEVFRLEAQRASRLFDQLIALVDRIKDVETRLLGRRATLEVLRVTLATFQAQLPGVCGVLA